MKTVSRMDTVHMEKATFTAEGFLRDCPIVTRTGIFEYRNPDGSIRREFRPYDEVCRADSLASYIGKPITLKHPNGLVTADNAKDLTVGTMLSEGKPEGDCIRADIIIYDRATIDSGKRQLSLGYAVDLDMTPGEYDGMRYDCIQRNIRINHLAVVDSARAGPQARLNLDENQIYDEEDKTTMAKIRLDNGLEYEAAQEVVVAFEALRKDHTDLQGRNKDIQKRLDTVEAERDTLKAKVDGHAAEIEKVKNDAAAELDAKVKARVQILQTAEQFGIEKADSLSDRQLKEAVIKKARNDDSLDLSQKSDEYIAAAFDFAIAESSKRLDTMSQQRQTIKQPGGKEREDGAPTSSAKARQRMIERQQNAYQGGKE